MIYFNTERGIFYGKSVGGLFFGKTIVPFATSGSSGIGDSGKNLAAIAKGARVEEGARFKANISEDKLREWAGAWMQVAD
ncbi:MAG: hypothetical protein K6F53_07060 [Lachnospiraceae bacterium]|nr:hypothetical protein [Lachnospiraceae bacterium]